MNRERGRPPPPTPVAEEGASFERGRLERRRSNNTSQTFANGIITILSSSPRRLAPVEQHPAAREEDQPEGARRDEEHARRVRRLHAQRDVVLHAGPRAEDPRAEAQTPLGRLMVEPRELDERRMVGYIVWRRAPPVRPHHRRENALSRRAVPRTPAPETEGRPVTCTCMSRNCPSRMVAWCVVER